MSKARGGVTRPFLNHPIMADKIKVRFLKDHVNGIKKGDEGEFGSGRANYLVRVKVAEIIGESKPKKAPKKSKTTKDVKVEPCKDC